MAAILLGDALPLSPRAFDERVAVLGICHHVNRDKHGGQNPAKCKQRET